MVLRIYYAKKPTFLAAIGAVERDLIKIRTAPVLAACAEGAYDGDFERGMEIYNEMVVATVRKTS